MISGERLKALMGENGLTQSELARRVGLKQPTIYRLLNGDASGTTHLHKIARELRTSPAYLTGETDDPSPDALLPEPVTSEEREWIEHLRGLLPRDRAALLQIARTMATMAASPALNAPVLPFHGEKN